MYTITDKTADSLITEIARRQRILREALRRKDMQGDANAEQRASIRAKIEDYDRVIAGLNTGEGVTRGSEL